MDQSFPQSSTSHPERTHRADEALVFVVLAILIWPVLAIGFIGAYGFVVWMSQLVFGPPGPLLH